MRHQLLRLLALACCLIIAGAQAINRRAVLGAHHACDPSDMHATRCATLLRCADCNILTGTGFPWEGCKQDPQLSLYRCAHRPRRAAGAQAVPPGSCSWAGSTAARMVPQQHASPSALAAHCRRSRPPPATPAGTATYGAQEHSCWCHWFLLS